MVLYGIPISALSLWALVVVMVEELLLLFELEEKAFFTGTLYGVLIDGGVFDCFLKSNLVTTRNVF